MNFSSKKISLLTLNIFSWLIPFAYEAVRISESHQLTADLYNYLHSDDSTINVDVSVSGFCLDAFEGEEK